MPVSARVEGMHRHLKFIGRGRGRVLLACHLASSISARFGYGVTFFLGAPTVMAFFQQYHVPAITQPSESVWRARRTRLLAVGVEPLQQPFARLLLNAQAFLAWWLQPTHPMPWVSIDRWLWTVAL